MIHFNLIKHLNLTLNFGRDKKIEIAGGKHSEGVIVLSSPLETKAVDLSRNSTLKRTKRIKPIKVV